MLDYLYKLSRKKLDANLYNKINMGVFGRAKKRNRIETYHSIFLNYQKVAKHFVGKTVLEVGGGNQIFTALFFLEAGAKKVVLVDPKTESITDETIESAIKKFKQFCPHSSISKESIDNDLSMFSDLKRVSYEYNASVDFMFSHLVLEHFGDLSSFFMNISRLLKGLSYNVVDLSDHTYHIFSKWWFTQWILRNRELFHLRYSKKTFARINDDKCYMNRILLPQYVAMAEKHRLKVKILDTVAAFKKPKIHNDVLKQFESRDPNDIYITSFRMIVVVPTQERGRKR